MAKGQITFAQNTVAFMCESIGLRGRFAVYSIEALLHFALGMSQAKCILVAPVCVSVCLSVPRRILTLLHVPGCNFGE